MKLAKFTESYSRFYFIGFLSNPYEEFMAIVLDMYGKRKTLFVRALNKTLVYIISIFDE